MRLPCVEYEISAPITVKNRILSINRSTFSAAHPGIGPVWNPVNGGSEVVAYSGTDALSVAAITYSFPVVPGESFSGGIPVTFSLYDERRELHSGSDVRLDGNGMMNALVSPSVQGTLSFNPTAPTNSLENTVILSWKSKGVDTGYSNLFFLVMDGGVTYGQTEYWISVSRWS